MKDVVKNGINKELFTCAKMDTLSSLLRRTETAHGKVSLLANKLLDSGEGNVEDVINKIKNVNIAQCNSVAGILDAKYNWAIMLPEK